MLVVRLWKKFRFPLWIVFRLRNRDLGPVEAPATPSPSVARTPRGLPRGASRTEDVQSELDRKEQNLRTILRQYPGKRFLEIGIGDVPNMSRMELIRDEHILYLGCDFEPVCSNHRKELERLGLMGTNIEFLGNETGNYNWTLFELVKQRQQYDVIYLDGHHTFYIDLPAVCLIEHLLKPGGVVMIDDIEWTLISLRKQMAASFDMWQSYRTVYDFDQYTEEQQRTRHVRMIVEEILIRRLQYRKLEELLTPYWWALQKPV